MRGFFQWLLAGAILSLLALPLSAQVIVPEAPTVLQFGKANMVPLPPLVELLQADLTVDGATLTVLRAGKSFFCTVDSRDARQNGKKLRLDVAPFRYADIPYVSVEALLKALGGKSAVDAESNSLILTLANAPELRLPIAAMKGDVAAFRKGDSEIFVARTDGSGVRQLTYNVADEMLVTFSHDNASIVYNQGMDIWRRPVNAPLGVNLTANFSAIGVASAGAVPAPDGGIWFMQAVLEGEYAQEIPDICRMQLDGSAYRRVTTGINPLLSADGKLVVYTTQNPDGVPAVFAMDAEGMNKRQLTLGMLDACSADGSFVIVQREPAQEPVEEDVEEPVMNVPGMLSLIGINTADGTVLFPANDQAQSHEAFSSITPDGKHIVYLQQDNGIWVMDVDRGNQRQLTDNADDWMPRLSHDGTQVAFTRGNSLHIIPFAGGEPTLLSPGIMVRDFSFSADGSQIIFSGMTEANRVALMAPPPAVATEPGKYAPPTQKEIDAAAKAGTQRATVETTRGKIVLELYGADAPLTVANFVKLAKAKYYNGLTFHRVEPGFVIQGGDPNGDGSGGPGYSIKLEISPKLRHVLGALAMARSMEPDSAGSQFYITLEENAGTQSLDDNYAVFGKVVTGMDVVQKITVGDKITKITIK